MNIGFLRTKTGIAVIVLVAVFVFLYLFSGVFGGTFIGVTLRTNPDLERGLIGHWTFDGSNVDWSLASAEVRDVSGSGKHGNALGNDADAVKPGAIGQALNFNIGTDDYVEVDNSDNHFTNSQFTYTAWIKPRTVGEDLGGGAFAAGVHLIANDVSFGLCTGATACGVARSDTIGLYKYWSGDDGVWTAPDGVIKYNEWQHVAVTYDYSSTANDAVIYINGESVTITEASTPTGAADTNTNNFIVGRGGATTEFDGLIDGVRVYDRLLSAPEIQRLYQLGATTKIAETIDTNPDLRDGLILHYTFDGSDIDTSDPVNEILDSGSLNDPGGWIDHSSTTVAGVLGQGIDFDGNDDYILVSGAAALNEDLDAMTYAVWIYPTGWGGGSNGNIFSQNDGLDNTPTKQLRLNNAGSEASLRAFTEHASTNGSVITSDNSIKLNEWQHITFTFDDFTDKTIRLYLNGEEMSYDTQISGVDALKSAANDELWIAGHYDLSPGNDNFNGYLDDFRIYDRALSTSSIKRLYELGATTKIAETISTNPDLENGLVGHWTFDGWPDMDTGSSTAEVKDMSGNDNHGDWENHATSTVPGKIGQALEFDGSDDEVNIGNPTTLENLNTNPLTLTAWIRPESFGGVSNTQYILSKNTAVVGWQFDTGTGSFVDTLYFRLTFDGDDLQVYTEDNELMLNKWQHVAVVWGGTSDSADTTFYVDGVNIGRRSSGNVDGTGSPDDDSGSSARIGGGRSDTASTFDGMIDDARVYNRALSDAEILRLYQLGL